MDHSGTKVVDARKRAYVEIIDLTDEAPHTVKAQCTKATSVESEHQVSNEVEEDQKDGDEDEDEDENILICHYCNAKGERGEIQFCDECEVCCCEACFPTIGKCGFECDFSSYTCESCCTGAYCYAYEYPQCEHCSYNHPERCGCNSYSRYDEYGHKVHSDDESEEDDFDEEEEDDEDDEEEEEIEL